MRDGFKLRVRLVYLFIFLFGAILLTRLFFIQVVRADYYKKLVNGQYVVPAQNYFDRGIIYFKEKGGQLISAATVKNGFELALNPKILENPEAAYEKLSGIISIDKALFLKRAGKKNDPYEIVARRLDVETAKKIKNLNIKGVDVFAESWRFYPAESLASHVLGFIGYKDDTLIGRYGLESYYEQVLTRDSDEFFANSFAEIFLDIKKKITPGLIKGDIVLAIEPSVQTALEKNLKKTAEKYEVFMAGGVIIEPKTGKILAMAVTPDFNPNAYSEIKDFSIFMNPVIESVFEMGSIMKPLTLAAALNEKVITSETTYNDNGYLELDKTRIKNYDMEGRGVVSMQEVLNQSLNTGAVFAMQKMGKEKFRKYLADYGLGEKTGIDLPEEVAGMISRVMESPREIECATASFGQGIAVTPIEMASALASLANGGFLMKPYVAEEIIIAGGANKKIEPQIKRQVLKKETSEEISRMLVKVVDDALLGGIYKMEHYSVAAKTGTAQFVQEGEAGYKEGEYIHTFFGYAPAFDARFLTLLFLVKPQGVRYASHSLTEPFMDMTKFLLNYYEIPPDR